MFDVNKKGLISGEVFTTEIILDEAESQFVQLVRSPFPCSLRQLF
jgi:hypothetical protein